MGNFLVPGEDDFTGSNFGILSPDRYKVRIVSYQVKSGADTIGQYNPDGDPRVWFTLEPLEVDGDPEAALVDYITKEPVSEDKTLIFFFDPKRLGLKPVVAKSRAFFAAAMGIPVEQRVVFNDLTDLCDSLIGRELVVSVDVTKTGKNSVTNPSPVRTRVKRGARSTGNQDLAAQAAAIFNEQPAEEPSPEPVEPVEEPAY